jgi:hypothetical protein
MSNERKLHLVKSAAGAPAVSSQDVTIHLLTPREAEFLENYQRCSEERKRHIERQALRTRNGLPIEQWEDKTL